MAAAAVMTSTLVPILHRVHDGACRMISAGPPPDFDRCLIGGADAAAADGAATILDLDQPVERQ